MIHLSEKSENQKILQTSCCNVLRACESIRTKCMLRLAERWYQDAPLTVAWEATIEVAGLGKDAARAE